MHDAPQQDTRLVQMCDVVGKEHNDENQEEKRKTKDKVQKNKKMGRWRHVQKLTRFFDSFL